MPVIAARSGTEPPPEPSDAWIGAGAAVVSTIAATASGLPLGFKINTTAMMISTAMPAMMAMAMRFCRRWRISASYCWRVRRRGALGLGLFCICIPPDSGVTA